MININPLPRETTRELLHRLVGRFIFLNVTVNGTVSSVCVNIRRDGAAAWRKVEDGVRRCLNLDSPGFGMTDRTLVLSYDDVNTLANNFQVIWEAVPPSAVVEGGVGVGNVSQTGDDMRLLLAGLEQRSGDILAIEDALVVPLDTSLLSIRRALSRSVVLTEGGGLSDNAKSVLAAFSESQRVYAGLPRLRGFGIENEKRGRDVPCRGDGRLRYYLQHNPVNSLATSRPLDYVAYELKPLNISGLKWNCSCDPRTDSLDLLMSFGGSPIFTEVKMAGDKFVSAAVVQVLYYASILANDRQKDRLAEEIPGLRPQPPWICVIAQQRDDSGFASDLDGAVRFLQHQETRDVLSPYFMGAIVLVIQENGEPFCGTRAIPSFRAVEHGEYYIEWQG